MRTYREIINKQFEYKFRMKTSTCLTHIQVLRGGAAVNQLHIWPHTVGVANCTKVTQSFCHHLDSMIRHHLSHLNLLLWNHWTKLSQTWQGGRSGQLDTILKGAHIRNITSTFGLIWILSFRENLNVIIYQNMPNLHNWYKSAERKL
jgi:hypothetical protein